MSDFPKLRPGTVFEHHVIEAHPDLKDIPSLSFCAAGHWTVVQTSHVHRGSMRFAGWDLTAWRYQRTTHEWVPCFQAVSSEVIIRLCDICEDLDNEGGLWVTPKGCPRQMFRESDEAYGKRLAADQATWNEAQVAVYALQQAADRAYDAHTRQLDAEQKAKAAAHIAHDAYARRMEAEFAASTNANAAGTADKNGANLG